MRVLVCMPHYYAVSRERDAVHGSSQDGLEERARNIDYCLKHALALTRGRAELIGTLSAEPNIVGNADGRVIANTIYEDIVICTHADNHILSTLAMEVSTPEDKTRESYASRIRVWRSVY